MIELFYKTCVQPGFIHMHTHTQAHTYTMFTQQTRNAVELKAHLFSVLTLNLCLRWVCMSMYFCDTAANLEASHSQMCDVEVPQHTDTE